MSKQGGTYSFIALSGGFVSQVGITILFGGQLGVGELVFSNTTEHTVHDTAADGVIMPSFIPGDAGVITIRCQQTSIIHVKLLAWLNLLKTAAMNNDVSNWANTVLNARNALTGTFHNASGISPQKVPDYSYQAAGQNITWQLPCCNLVNQ